MNRHWFRKRRAAAITITAMVVGSTCEGCFNSDLAKRFREAYAPGLAEGLATAVATPGAGETGLRQAWAALFEGLGAILNVKSSTTSSASGS